MTRATMADVVRIRAEIAERNRREDALFDEWWAANKWRLPIRPYLVTSVCTEYSFGPEMLEHHHWEFDDFCKERGL